MNSKAPLLLTTLLAALAVPATASAAVNCDFVPGTSPRVDVTLTASSDQARIAVDSFGYIRVNDNQCFDPAINAATTTTVDEIRVADSSDGSTEVEIVEPDRFAPGDTSELGTSEIEFSVDSGAGSSDMLTLTGNDGDADHFVAGANGINVNATDPFPDTDIVATAIEKHFFNGFGGGDHLSAGGGEAGTGGPSPVQTRITGAAGDDLVGGGSGDDDLGGGQGTDRVSYAGATAGVSVDLGTVNVQDTGGAGKDTIVGFEQAQGSSHADRLTAATNVVTILDGSGGDDVLTGSTLSDAIQGGPGNDLLDDGGGFGSDLLDGDSGTDTLTYARASNEVHVKLEVSYPQNTFGAGQDMISFVENLEGSPFNDRLGGSPDENVITGLAGTDAIDGGGGPDEFRVRDGEKDEVECGDGTDIVSADRAGVDMLTNCETVDFVPAPEAPGNGGGNPDPGAGDPGTGNPPTDNNPPSQNPTPPPALDTAILFRTGGSKSQAALRNRYVKVTGTCPAERCTVSARPAIKVARKGRKAAITRTLPAVQATLLPAVQKTLKVKLSKKDVATLKAAKRRRAKATITIALAATDAAGNTTAVNRTVTVR